MKNKDKRFWVNASKTGATKRLANSICKAIKEVGKEYDKIVILCVGSEKINGDMVGPVSGTFLIDMNNIADKCEVYGKLGDTVHTKNIKEVLSKIDTEKSLVISIVSCLGTEGKVGKISILRSGVIFGRGVGKTGDRVGDIAIQGVVGISNRCNMLNFNTLACMDMERVIYTSSVIKSGVIEALNKLEKEKMEQEDIVVAYK